MNTVVQTLIEHARSGGAPIVEGERATFVWEGDSAPGLGGDFNNWGWIPGDEFERIGLAKLEQVEPGVWTHAVTLSHDAYVEYSYFQDGKRVLDPLNLRKVWNGVDADNNYFGMPDYKPTPLLKRKPEMARGELSTHAVKGGHTVVGGERRVHLYAPPVKVRVPLLVVFDGQDYLVRAQVPTIVDNLIAEGRIRPIALAMVEHGDQARFVEYATSEATVAFLMRHVLPLARAKLRLVDTAVSPGAYGVLGASMGGLISLYTALRVPEVFGRVLSQSGAFGLENGGAEPFIFEHVRHRRATELKIWMDVGRFEFLLHANRHMRDALGEAGYNVTYREYAGGHNYTCWRDDVGRGLEALFGSK